MTRKLKLGLLLESYEVSSWEYAVIETLINSDYASVDLVILNGLEREKKSLVQKLISNRRGLVFILYRLLDQRVFKQRPDAFEIKSSQDLLSQVPQINVKPTSTEFSDWIVQEDIDLIKSYNPDILLRFGFRILRGGILSASKYGIWSYHHGDNRVNRGGPAGCWEVLQSTDVTGSIVQILSEDLDGGKVLARSYSRTDKRSINRSRNGYFWKSVSMMPRKIEELYNVGEKKFFQKVESQNSNPDFYSQRLFTPQKLDNWTSLKLLTAHTLRFLRDRVVKSIYLDQWILLFSLREGLSKSFWRFKKIIPPKKRFYADPFIVHRDGRYYIFIEEFIYETNRGHISVIEMDENGNYKEPVRVIERPYHLSYPFIFEYSGEYYLIPESSQNKTIELYKCTAFPYKWEFQMKLMEDVEAFDSTLLHHGNRWWLFVNIIENRGASGDDELFLFYADNPTSGSWIPHPMNPVVSDVRKSRPAGRIFKYGKKLLRPSQNCSKRYGYGMKINEIVKLTETDYVEKEIESIEPDWDKNLKATHTINSEGNLTVIDAVFRRRRFF